MYSDEQLVDGCKKNDHSMQKALYEKYAPKLMAVALRYASTTAEAEDNLQDAMIKAFNKIESFKGESAIFFWLKRIVINTSLNALRSKAQLNPIQNYEEKVAGEAWQFISDLQLDDLIKMIQELPAGCRAVFNLMAIEGYKHEEIAKELGISIGTSKSQFSRAKLLLQEKLNQEELRSHG